MKVIVPEKCDRCKREVPQEIDSTEIAAFEAATKKRQSAYEAIEQAYQTVQNDYQEATPDLVVLFRGTVRSINHICNEFCMSPVTKQLDDVIFRSIDTTKRKPRQKKDTEKKDTEKAAKKDAKKDAS